MIFIWIAASFAVLISYQKDRTRTSNSLRKSLDSFRNLSPGLLGLVSAVGLILAIVPEKLLIRIFTIPDTPGIILVSIIGAVVNIPGPIAFPLAAEFVKIGIKPAVLASFLTTLTMVGMVSSPLEISTFGMRFTFWRQFLSLIAAIVIGLIMGVFL